MPDAATALVVFLFGLLIGSFLNVCIVRLPSAVTDERISTFQLMLRQLRAITFPPSACPKCSAPIRPYDNIPVISYLFLRGRCRACHAKISPQYPAVELLTALLFLACYETFGLSGEAVKWAIFVSLIVVLAFTDVNKRILPDLVTLGGAALGLTIALAVPVSDGSALWLANRLFAFPPPSAALSFIDALLGAAIMSGALWIFGKVFSMVIHRPALGFGDVKMIATLGAFLGLKKTFVALLVGTFIGSVIGLALVLGLFLVGFKIEVARRASRRGLGPQRALRYELARRYQLPFGTFLAVGAVFSALLGNRIVAWYASLL